jgi:hypothetical protein
MANISQTLYTFEFFGSVLKSPTSMGSLSVNNLVMNISRLGTFKTIFYFFTQPAVENQKPSKKLIFCFSPQVTYADGII